MRVLTGEYIFQEVSKDVFQHSRHSMTLAGSPGARSFMSFMYVDKCKQQLSNRFKGK